MSNRTSAFIINPQSEIHSTDEQRIRISGSATGCGLEEYFHETIVIIPSYFQSQMTNSIVGLNGKASIALFYLTV